MRCIGGDASVRFPSLEQSAGEVWILREGGGEVTIERVVSSAPIDLGKEKRAESWFTQGVLHVLFGWDHLIFVVLLVLLMPRRGQLILAITGFTVGHSIVLLTSKDLYFPWSSSWVEAMIAFSIAFLAAELLAPRTASLSRKYPFLLSGLFGVIHGCGFSDALRDWGIGESFFATLTFNLGVEGGQLVVVALTLALLSFGSTIPKSTRTSVRWFTLYTIGALTTVVGVIRLFG